MWSVTSDLYLWFRIFLAEKHRYEEELIVLIIKNTPHEKDLKVSLSLKKQQQKNMIIAFLSTLSLSS